MPDLLRGVPPMVSELLVSEFPEIFLERGADRHLDVVEMYAGKAQLSSQFRRAARQHVVFCTSCLKKVLSHVT